MLNTQLSQQCWKSFSKKHNSYFRARLNILSSHCRAFNPFAFIVLLGVANFSVADVNDNNLNNNAQQVESVDFYNLSLAELGKVKVSIATGNATQLDKAPATATVIYAAQIEAMGARTLDDVLEIIPGLHVSLSSLSRLDSVYSMRGIHTGFNPQVLMMINGVPLKISLQGSRPTLFRLPVQDIERIEVIRGPGSAIYGADAYAGVINIITKDASSIEKTRVSLRRGSFNSNDFSMQIASNWKGYGIAFTTELLQTDGDPSRKISTDLQTALDTAFGTHASLAPGSVSTRYKIVDSHLAVTDEKIQFNLWNWAAINDGVGAGAAQALDPAGRQDANLLQTDFTDHFYKSEHWDHSVRVSLMHQDESNRYRILPPGAVAPIGTDGNVNFVTPVGAVLFSDGLIGNPAGVTNNREWELISVYSGFESHRIRIAAGQSILNVDSSETKNFGPGVLDRTPLPALVNGNLTNVQDTPYIFLGDISRSMRYLSLQDEWQLAKDLNLTSGVRYDDYSDVGSTTNPRIALVWENNEKLTTKIMLGSAFREPSLAELYYKNNPISLGNQQVQPETLRSEEISFNYRPTHQLQNTLTFFNYQARDMIDFYPDAGATTKTAQNKKSQDGKGFEWELDWRPSAQLQLGASYSLQKAKDNLTHQAVPDAPGQQIKINANWQFMNQWTLSSQIYRVADRARAMGDTRPDIPDYTWINFSLLRKNILPHADISFSVRNAADANAREPSASTIPNDYPLESRSFWLGLSFSFD